MSYDFIELSGAGGLPMFIKPKEIIAFGRINYDGCPSLKSFILLSGQTHQWELRTEYDELQRLIAGALLEAKSTKGEIVCS